MQKISILIGITGHRDIPASGHASVQKAIEQIIKNISSENPHTPITFVSPLAEGADRVAAQAALDCGCELVVPLPMEEETYLQDFGTEASRAEFQTLKGKASEVYTLPEPLVPEAYRNERSRYYAHVGAYIARYCQVLIAVWDGEQGEGVGGTAEIVKYALTGEMECLPDDYVNARLGMELVDTSPVYHVVVPGRLKDGPVDRSLQIRRLFAADYVRSSRSSGYRREQKKRFDKLCNDLDDCNRDVATIIAKAPPDLQLQESRILSPLRLKDLPPAITSLFGYFVNTDHLAIHYQQQTMRIVFTIYALALLLVASIGVSQTPGMAAPGMTVYVLALGAAYGVFLWGKRRKYQIKFLDYRALAEGLRVQIYWRLLEWVAPSRRPYRMQVADHYLRRQQNELVWICETIRMLSMPKYDDQLSANIQSIIACVVENWIHGQEKYFIKSMQRDLGRSRLFNHASIGFFVGSMIVGAGIVYSEFVAPIYDIDTLVEIASALAAIAALCRAVIFTMGYKEHAKQYGRMAEIFGRAVAMSENIDTPEKLTVLAEELGWEALMENADWLVLHRERPIEVAQ